MSARNDFEMAVSAARAVWVAGVEQTEQEAEMIGRAAVEEGAEKNGIGQRPAAEERIGAEKVRSPTGVASAAAGRRKVAES